MAVDKPLTLGALALAQEAKRRQRAQQEDTGLLSDLGNAVVSGVESIPGALTGLADIPLGALGFDHPISHAADALGELTGFQPSQWAKQRQSLYSQDTKQALQEFHNADGWLDTAGALLSNPRLIAITAAQSAPSIFAGGALGRVAKAMNPELTAAGAGAAGEGAIMAGQQMDSLQGQESGPFADALTAAATGVLGGLIAKKGADIAQKRGVTDINTAMVSGKLDNTSGAVVPAMLQEGGEEALQSASETLLSNLNTGADLTSQLPQNVLLGAATGAAMGGAANFVPQFAQSILPSNEELRNIAKEVKDAMEQGNAKPTPAGATQGAPATPQTPKAPEAPEAPIPQGAPPAEPAPPAPQGAGATKPAVSRDTLDKLLRNLTQDSPTEATLIPTFQLDKSKADEALSKAVEVLSQLPESERAPLYELPLRTRSRAPVLVERDGQLTYLKPKDVQDETARNALVALALKHASVDELAGTLLQVPIELLDGLADAVPHLPTVTGASKFAAAKFNPVVEALPTTPLSSDFIEKFYNHAKDTLNVADEVRPEDLVLAAVVTNDDAADIFKATLPTQARIGIDLLREIERSGGWQDHTVKAYSDDKHISWLVRADSVHDALSRYMQNPADESANLTLSAIHNLVNVTPSSPSPINGTSDSNSIVENLTTGLMQTLSMSEDAADRGSPEHARNLRDIFDNAAHMALNDGDNDSAAHLFEAASLAVVSADKALAHFVSNESKAQKAWEYMSKATYPYGQAHTTELLTANEKPSLAPEDVTKIVEHDLQESLPEDVSASERWKKITQVASRLIPASYRELLQSSTSPDQVHKLFRPLAERDPMLSPLLQRSASILEATLSNPNKVASEFKTLPAVVIPSTDGAKGGRIFVTGVMSQLSKHLPNHLLTPTQNIVDAIGTKYIAPRLSKSSNGFALPSELLRDMLKAGIGAINGLTESDKTELERAIDKIHLPTFVQIGANVPDHVAVAEVLYHELFHAAVTPAIRAVAPSILKKALREFDNTYYAGKFARSVHDRPKDSKLQLPAEEAIAYLITDIASAAAEQGMSPIQYLNRNVRNKGLKTLLTKVILPKIRAALYKNNLMPKGKKADINTVFELIRQYTASPTVSANTQNASLGVLNFEGSGSGTPPSGPPSEPPAGSPSTPPQGGGSPIITTLRYKTTAAKYTLARMSDAFNFTHRLIEQASEYLGHLPKLYMQLMEEQAAKVRTLTSDLHDISQQLSAVDDAQTERAVKLLNDAQQLNHGVGADTAYWPFMPEWMTKEEQAKITVDPELQTQFEALSPQLQQVLKRMYELSYETSKLHLNALRAFTDAAMGDLTASDIVSSEDLPRIQQEMLKRLRRIESLLHRPYTPLMRDGQYVVVMESDHMRKLSASMQDIRNQIAALDYKIKKLAAEGDIGSETLAKYKEERRSLMAQLDKLRKEYEAGQGDHSQYAFYMVDSLEEAARIKQGLDSAYPTNSSFISERESLRERISNVDKLVDFAAASAKRVLGEGESSAIEALMNLYILEQHTNSVWNSFKDRKFVKGYNENLLASLARGIKARAASAVALQYTYPIREVLLKMQRMVDQAAPSQRLQMQRFVNEIIKRHQILTRPMSDNDRKLEDTVSNLLAANAWYTLLMSPRFYAQTWLQNLMTTFPLLSEFGAGAALDHLLKAHKDVWDARKRTRDEFGLGFIKGLFSGELLTSDSIKSERERALLDSLWTAGVLDVGLTADMGEFDNLIGGSKLKTKLRRGHYMFMHLARVADLHARAAAGMAAYRLKYKNATAKEVLEYKQRENLKTADEARHKLAVEYAKKTLLTAHGNYSNLNAPRAFIDTPFLRHGAGRLITQFRKFQLIQLYMIADLIRAASKKATTPEEKAAVAVARKQLAIAGATILGMTGLLGMPAAATIIHLVAFAGGDDLPDDEAVTLKLREWFGPAADLALHGLPSLVGVNLTDMAGFQNILSIAPYNQLDISKDGYAELLAALSGAPGSTIGRLMDSFKLASEGRFLDAAAVGLPSGPRQVLDTIRMHVEGGLRDKSGNLYMRKEDISATQEVLHMLNLSPMDISRTKEIHYGIKAVQSALNEKQQELLYAMAEAYRANDREAVNDLIQEWVDLQKLKLKWGIKPSPAPSRSILRKLKKDYQFLNGVPYTPPTVLAVKRLTDVKPL